jgi:hypothetical protein
VLGVVQQQLRSLIARGKVTARIPRQGYPIRYRALLVLIVLMSGCAGYHQPSLAVTLEGGP